MAALPKACKTMPEWVVSTATACLQAASRGESDSHMSQLGIDEADSL